MRVLVTGGAGFIGSHIVDQLLLKGHQPFVIDNLSTGDRRNVPQNVPLHVVDICDGPKLAEAFDSVRPEWVCHQAAQMSVSRSMREPLFDAEVNAMGMLRVLDNAARVGAKKIVFASSGGVLYGDVTTPATEGFPIAPISPYGITKWVGERYMEFYARERGLNGVALRYSNVFGPRQNPHGEAGVVAIFAQRMLAGEYGMINGDGHYIRDYVYAIDVARANVLAMESNSELPFQALNIGTGTGTDVNQLADMIRSQVQKHWQTSGRSGTVPECQHGPARSGDLRSNLVNADLAQTVLGWRPNVTLSTGIRDTVTWFATGSA